MTLVHLSDDQFEAHANAVSERYFEQSDSMAKLLRKRGYEVELLGYKDPAGQLQVSSLIYSTPVAGGLHAEIHFGPIFNDISFLKPFLLELKGYMTRKKVMEVEIKPYQAYQYFDDHGKPTSQPHLEIQQIFEEAGYHYQGLTNGMEIGDWHYLKSLEGLTEKDLLKSFSKKGKPLVKKAKSFGTNIRHLQREELAILKEITTATSNRRDYNDKPLEYYQYLYDSFGDQAQFLVATLNFKDYYQNLERDQAKLKQKLTKLEAALQDNPTSEKKNNQYKEFSSQYQTFETRKAEAQTFIDKYQDQDVVLCGAVFLFTKQEAVYFFSGSYPEFNKFYAPAVLQEHIMLEAIRRGIPTYNLLGIAGDFDGSDGVLGFKQNFNGYITRHYGKFTFYPNPFKYKLIKGLKKLLRRT
ncbi:aminoacyltransferase [Streptococcus halichoeri]|uniref:aminoacyltransferase n=1 Tax=Streptococcus halichoeri TaxID=254785 RepID=UPI00135802D8|nr:aminoacyltransferase [Streptococcus halichoeri]